MVDTRFAVSVHVMTALANNQPDLVSSEELARSVKTNPSFIRKLVVSLSSAGLVQSVRGKAGGIRLAKSPREISLAEIYRAIAPTPRLAVPGKTPEKTCPIACGMGAVLCAISKEIEDGTLKMLAKRNLQEVLGQISGR
jgi:Rrf2 family protein